MESEGNRDRDRGRTPSYIGLSSRLLVALGSRIEKEEKGKMGMFEVCTAERWCAHVKVADDSQLLMKIY